jgi:hypothetical protein
MRTINLLKITTVILLGIALNGNVQAGTDKNTRHARITIGQLTHSVKLNSDDLRVIQQLFAQTEAVNVLWNNHELKFTACAGTIPEFTVRFESMRTEPVEDWMLQTDYLSEETALPVESWMLDTDYLDEPDQTLESWMFSDTRLTEVAAESHVEPWMLDAHYLSR